MTDSAGISTTGFFKRRVVVFIFNKKKIKQAKMTF